MSCFETNQKLFNHELRKEVELWLFRRHEKGFSAVEKILIKSRYLLEICKN
jgi:hypothetical protein